MFDFEDFSKQLNEYQAGEKDLQREQRKQLFYEITSGWDNEDDIDYSVPISTLIKILVESPQYIMEVVDGKNRLGDMSKRMDKAAYALKTPRLL